MPLRTSRAVTALACIMGAVAAVFGVLDILDPAAGLSFFELPVPVSADGLQLLETLMMVIGIRDVFLGVAVWTTAAFGSRRVLGLNLLAAGACATVDGIACKVKVGAGEWTHWGYAPVLFLLGLIKLGIFG